MPIFIVQMPLILCLIEDNFLTNTFPSHTSLQIQNTRYKTNLQYTR